MHNAWTGRQLCSTTEQMWYAFTVHPPADLTLFCPIGFTSQPYKLPLVVVGTSIVQQPLVLFRRVRHFSPEPPSYLFPTTLLSLSRERDYDIPCVLPVHTTDRKPRQTA